MSAILLLRRMQQTARHPEKIQRRSYLRRMAMSSLSRLFYRSTLLLHESLTAKSQHRQIYLLRFRIYTGRNIPMSKRLPSTAKEDRLHYMYRRLHLFRMQKMQKLRQMVLRTTTAYTQFRRNPVYLQRI